MLYLYINESWLLKERCLGDNAGYATSWGPWRLSSQHVYSP